MKLIKTETEFYGSDNKGDSFVICVNDESFDSDGELQINVKPTTPDRWFSPSDYRLFLNAIIKSITELEIIYGQKTNNQC